MAKGDHLYDCYNPPKISFDRGEGAYLYTKDGDKYLDFIAGISVTAFGHGHPDLVQAVKDQSEKLWHLSNLFRIDGQHDLADKYCNALPWAGKIFFTNSGAESIECALKTARRYQFGQGHPERIDILTFSGAFHGRTLASVNATGNPKYLEGFGPGLPGYVNLPFGDHDALKAAITDTTAAIMVEPVQGEGGLRALPAECLRGLRELCDENGLVLIYDEVQCGAGRTGKLFAHEWAGEDAYPDIITAAKGIGGGFPLGACIASEEVAKHMVPGTHGSTYGGNPMAMAVGNIAFDIMSDPAFLENVVEMSNVMKQQFESLKDEFPDVVVDVRGKGLLCGMKLKKNNVKVRMALFDDGFLVGTAGDNVLRMAPPLIISPEHIREAVGKLRKVFTQAQDWDDV
ncbi:MAG: aspartate aminotransferase family protein [Litorimonas sp.]